MKSEPGLRSLPARRPEPRSGDHRVRNQGRFCNIVEGVLSPLLSNLMLDEFDRELTRRGLRFCRYADDCAPRRREEEALM